MTTNPPANDAEDGRRVRINNKILELCSKPKPPETNPTLIGVGLYTHIAQPRNSALANNDGLKPEFLPLNGHDKVKSTRQIKQQTQPDEEVVAVYRQLREAVEAEEKIWKRHNDPVGQRRDSSHDTSEPSITSLQKKYGNAFTTGTISELAIRNVSTKRRHSEIAGGSSKADEPQQKRKMSLAQITELRRKSGGDIDIFGHPKAVRQGSESKNMYDEERDPRRKGK